MCGILVAISNDRIDVGKIEQLLSEMVYRGPDSSDIQLIDLDNINIVLGFNRLAIQDLAADANQPFFKHGITIVFNGEVYNQLTLRKHLESVHNADFQTTSDTEVVLEMYKAYGETFLDQIRGMFSIVVVDTINKKILACRDRFGIKPLFMTKSKTGIYFSSDIKSLIHFADNKNFNLEYFASRGLLDPFVGFDKQTPFLSIESVEAATLLSINCSLHVSTRRYYDATKMMPAHGTDSTSIRKLLVESISEHLISDVPIGGALSGGFDSSLISVVASNKVDGIKLFSVKIDEHENESSKDLHFAKKVYESIQKPGTEHIEAHVNSDISLSTIDRVVRALGTPIYDQRVFVWDQLYKTAKDNGIKVVLNGQGADELWYGYYPNISLWKWFSSLYHDDLNAENVDSYFRTRYNQSTLRSVYSDQIMDTFTSLIDRVYREISSLSGEKNRKISIYMLNTVLQSILNYEDVLSMLNTVEVRVPYLDHRLVEVALAIPCDQHLMDTKRGKDFLKQIFADVLPKEVVEREKTPLPKSRASVEQLLYLFEENLEQIKQSKLIQQIYNVTKLSKVTVNVDTSFYGGQAEALLQILSTWRFEELFHS